MEVLRRYLGSIIDHPLTRIEMIPHRYFPVSTTFPVKREHPMYHKVRRKMTSSFVSLSLPAQSTSTITSIYLQSHILCTPYTTSRTSDRASQYLNFLIRFSQTLEIIKYWFHHIQNMKTINTDMRNTIVHLKHF